MSGKLVFLFELLEQTRPLKEKVLVFSQSLLTLDLIEEFLSRPEWGDYIRAVDYCRLDGSSAADTRTANMTEFNKIGNDRSVVGSLVTNFSACSCSCCLSFGEIQPFSLACHFILITSIKYEVFITSDTTAFNCVIVCCLCG